MIAHTPEERAIAIEFFKDMLAIVQRLNAGELSIDEASIEMYDIALSSMNHESSI